jgi:hypothetical protein
VPNHSLDIYLRQLVLEAIRLEATQIRVRDDGQKTHIEFVVAGEPVPYPHAPHRRYGRLMPRLREIAGVGANRQDEHEVGRGTVPWRDEDLPLDFSFSKNGGEDIAVIDLKHVPDIKPVA